MKKQILILCVIAFSILSACSNSSDQTTNHAVQLSPDGKDSVVYVNYRNNDGSFTNFYMDYLLYTTLYNQGGYNSCYNYYHTYPSQFSNQTRYTSYKTVNHYYNTSNSSTSRPTKANNNSYSSPSRSYSTPKSSSSPSRSYSSPSRSSSSPSRSYSSPSRSYSSPSRSYSSPSRSSRR